MEDLMDNSTSPLRDLSVRARRNGFDESHLNQMAQTEATPALGTPAIGTPSIGSPTTNSSNVDSWPREPNIAPRT